MWPKSSTDATLLLQHKQQVSCGNGESILLLNWDLIFNLTVFKLDSHS